MRTTITAVALCLLAALLGAGLAVAAEPEFDEKLAAPKSAPPAPSVPEGAHPRPDSPVPTPATPGKAGTVIIVPPPPGLDGTTVPMPGPARETPDQEKTGIAPHPSDQSSPMEIPVIPVLPDRTSPAEVPAVPVLPRLPDRTTILTPPLQRETTPDIEDIQPYRTSPQPESPSVPEPGKQASPLDFLPMPTPLIPEKTQREPKAEKDKHPGKAEFEEPQTAPSKQPKPAPPTDPKVPPPSEAEQARTKPEPGAPLRIPPDAAETGDLSFLEGCWRGTRPEYNSKRIITERFCFDKNGVGKRTINDPKYAGICTGATKGRFEGSKLVVTSEQGYCTGGAAWGPAYMVCEGEGNATPCYWRFPALGGAAQRYKIPLVRE